MVIKFNIIETNAVYIVIIEILPLHSLKLLGGMRIMFFICCLFFTLETIAQSVPLNLIDYEAIQKHSQQKDILKERTIKRTSPTWAEKIAKETKENSVLSWLQDKYSTMLQVMPTQINNGLLYKFIDEWYGVKYRMGGMSKSGIDCSAFVQKLYQTVFGMNIVRTACLQFQSAKYISKIEDLKEGDLVFFRINTSRISHVGVFLQNNCFVHSASSKGVSIANITNAYWQRYFAGGGRISEN